VVRDNRRRTPNIPKSVGIENAERARQIIQSNKHLTNEEKQKLIDTHLKDDDIHLLEKKITHNRVREMMEQQGGNGVFFIPDREHFQLANPEWKDDVWPEFMDGKNVFDFVDPDIKQKLEELEREEDEIRNKMEDIEDDQSSELDEDLVDAHDEVMENKDLIRKKHKLVTGSQLPRRVRDLTATERFMGQIRTDKAEGVETLKVMSHKKRQKEKERFKKSNVKSNTLPEDVSEDEDENQMVVEGVQKKQKKKTLTKEQEIELKKQEKLQHQKQAVVERLKRKIQNKWRSKGIVNEADRMIGSKLPKHLNSGKRGIGKTDRR